MEQPHPKTVRRETYGCVAIQAEPPDSDRPTWVVTARDINQNAVLASLPAADEFAAGREFQRLVDAMWPAVAEEIREFAIGKKP